MLENYFSIKDIWKGKEIYGIYTKIKEIYGINIPVYFLKCCSGLPHMPFFGDHRTTTKISARGRRYEGSLRYGMVDNDSSHSLVQSSVHT